MGIIVVVIILLSGTVLVSNISLQISALATNKRELNQVPINIDLEQVKDKTENDIRKMSSGETTGGGGTGDMWDILEKQGGIEVLKIKGNPMEIDIPEVNGIAITNVGFINNRLHIQTKWEKNDKDRHGYFHLIDEEGNKIEVKENNFSLVSDNDNEEVRDRYIEYILDVDKETLKHMRLMGYFAEDGQVIQGKWNLEIDLDTAGEIIKIPCDIQANTWNIKEVSLSPLGVTLKGTGTVGEKVNCSILMESGEIKEFDSVSTSNQAGDITMKFGVQVPLNVSTVTSIQIGKDTINLK